LKILEIRNESVVADVDGNITTRPNSPYYQLKYTTYENARIAYTFTDTQYIQETYDDRIFNCFCNGKRLQLRQDLANRLAVCIQQHELNGTCEYEALFLEAYNENPDLEILDVYLRNYDDVKFIKHEGYVIHNLFKIDLKGNAHVRETTEDKWEGQCIVMKGEGYSSAKTGCELADDNNDMRDVNALTLTILSKVLFMREPWLQEDEYIGYQNEHAKLLLNQLRGVDNA